MIINSIKLKNFRSYEDETTFSFTPENEKNIVLIGGENGAGKSTLFEAIKLCIYGPIAYGYIGQNHNYLTKIKNNINDNAFKNEDVEAFIGLSISFKEGTQIKEYYLKRSWQYINHKLQENFTVLFNNKELNDEDKLYFDKYLKSVLPPSLFDFFFFDGEELSEFFTGKSASNNLKDSVLQLFNYDTFDVLKKQLISYQRAQSKSNAKLEEVQINYENMLKYVTELKEQILSFEEKIIENEENLESLNLKKEQLEKDFRNSGGILEEERSDLLTRINKLENERSEINQYIKDFCNDTLPFLLIPNLLSETKNQIEKENAIQSYNSVKSRLSDQVLEVALDKYVKLSANVSYSDIAESILFSMFTNEEIDNSKSILEFSNEDKNSVIHIISNILSNENSLKKSIYKRFDRTKEISLKIRDLKNKLNSTVSVEILNTYLENESLVNTEISMTVNTLATLNSKIEQIRTELNSKEYMLTRARNEYISLLQNNNVLEISSNLTLFLDELLNNLTKDKINLIEEEFINIFSKIIRKDNYVNSIVIDDQFNSTLYINKDYDTNEVINILNNLGFEGTVKKYGIKFLDDLYSCYNVNNEKSLLEKLNNTIMVEYLTISTKININDFSKGEKQIYILCLIWAIIKSSGVEIPFIIDTPYARIDETHRNALTNIYLPNISKQVIILSTNKEIDNELYRIVKPHICNEYLLLYNTELRKTEVKNGYFEV